MLGVRFGRERGRARARAHASPFDSREYHERIDPHRHDTSLTDIVLGGQDGLVNVLGVVLGVGAATADSRVVLIAGLATTFAEAISMAAVAYTTAVAQREMFDSERAREYRHIQRVPAIERDEVRAIYAKKGLQGDLLERVVETITASPDVWVAVMLAEEHHVAPVSRGRALRSALVVGVAAAVGSLVPVVPFFFASPRLGMWIATAVAAVTLFVLGAYKARVTTGHVTKSGLEIAAIGILSALAGYGIGALLGATTTP